MKFLDVFTPITKGDFGLTDEAIYKSIQQGGEFIPIWGGNRNHDIPERMISSFGRTKHGKPITIFEGEGIIISLDGSAGSMTWKPSSVKFSLNHHAGFFKIKKGCKKMIDPKFFAIFCERHLSEISVSDGSKTLTIDQIYAEEFDLPRYDDQVIIMKTVQPLLENRKKLMTRIQKIRNIETKIFSHEYPSYQIKDEKIDKILESYSGNSGLTEKIIYNNIVNDGDRYLVLSSSTEDRTSMGEIPSCEINNKKLKTFQNKEGILVIRNGKAGSIFYLPSGKYASNDHAYILSIKDDCTCDVLLKWIMYQLKNEFLDFSSSSDNGTWNKTGFFKSTSISVPYKSEQSAIVREYEQLESIKSDTLKKLKKINSLVSKQIIFA